MFFITSYVQFLKGKTGGPNVSAELSVCVMRTSMPQGQRHARGAGTEWAFPQETSLLWVVRVGKWSKIGCREAVWSRRGGLDRKEEEEESEMDKYYTNVRSGTCDVSLTCCVLICVRSAPFSRIS